MKSLQERLKDYTIGLDYFTADDAEADVTLLEREIIEKEAAALTKEEAAILQKADKKALALFEAHKHHIGFAIPYLRAIVNIINHEEAKKAS